MFTGEDPPNSPRQLSAPSSQYLDQMALSQGGKKPNFPSPKFSTQITPSGQPTYDSLYLNMAQRSGLGWELLKPQSPRFYHGTQFNDSHCLNMTQRAAFGEGLLKPQPPPFYSSAKDDLPCGFGVNDRLVDLPPHKRFLIFDHSEDRMRLYIGPSLLQPPLEQAISSMTPPTDGDGNKIQAQMDQHFFVNEEKWDENHLADGESEMREDTEEINALLDSDSYDDDDDYDSDDDEVISPISDPSLPKDKVHNEEDFFEEVADSCNSRKRQRLLDGNYMKRRVGSESDVKSKRFLPKSYGNDYSDSPALEKEAKIRETLLVLTSMIPGLKNKKTLSIFDSSIVYLESMKIEAEALGLGSVESELPSYP